MNLIEKPYTGDENIVVGRHTELTGKTKLGRTWYGKLTVLFEVREILTVDYSQWDKYVELQQYVQSTEWIRP